MTDMLESVIVETSPNPEFTVIWMHGLGADGYDFVPVVRELDSLGIPGIKFIFPHANKRPVGINNGYVMRAWYDIKHTDLGRQEDEEGLRESQVAIEAIIAAEKERGLSSKQIALAGFSQGGAMTYQTGLRHAEPLAGLLSLSAYIPLINTIGSERHLANQNTPIFVAHGTADPIVPIHRGQSSADALVSLGYPVQWHTYGMPHSVCEEEIRDIAKFIQQIFTDPK